MGTGWGTDNELGSCPEAELLVGLATGRLAPDVRAGVMGHVQACAECGQVLAAFTRSLVAPVPSGAAGAAFGGLSPSGTLKLAANDPRLAPSGAHRVSGPPSGHVKPGDVLAGKYRVERVIGLGGMGVVVAATHLQLGQEVALKLMLPQAFASPDANERFLREARAAAQIQGEHVASVRDVGTLENGAPFMVMELLRGMDLSKLLQTRGGLPLEEAVDYVLQACEALAEAHGVGIIHRDLKPANLFLSERPDGSTSIKVLDFGISKSRQGGVDGNLTHSQSVMGTPRYMSPEQMRSTKMVGRATDVWALGCILYELLAARPAFDGDTTQGIAIAIAQDPAPGVRLTRPDVPQQLEQVLFRCLEKDVTRRVASVEELARLLAPFAPKSAALSIERIERLARRSQRPAGQSIAFAATVASAQGFPLPPPPVMTEPGFARSNPDARVGGGGGSWWSVPLGLLAGAAIVGLGVFLYLHGPGRSAAEATRAVAGGDASTAVAATSTPTPTPTSTPTSTSTPTPTSTSTSSATVAAAASAAPEVHVTAKVAPRPRPRPATRPAPISDSTSHDLDDRK
jgi:serine/threonine protein kinase